MGIHESQIGRTLGIFYEGYEKQIQEHGVYAAISMRLCMLMKKQEAQQEMKGRWRLFERKLWDEKSGDVLAKLENLRPGLQKWGRSIKYAKDRKRKSLRDRLVQRDSMYRDDDVIAEILDVKLELNWEMEKEELYWEQRARANWLPEGDKNTTFFHSKATQRQRLNHIRGLKDKNGIFKTEREDMETIVKDYLMELFKSRGVDNTNHLLSGVNMNRILAADYKEEEIVEALKSIGPTKASGPDGFPAIFF
ncbi:hypothetical protein J1N35_021455 [Gossypium stocksii]|uniref:Reverse transcriptase domain-containing protein n=1 Tax=Gossypium stocksii TaxID=47602 RepID=A0A9D3VGR9_9ROSI|nr:hypothetical protein J1N35_021455 [Gossypium stocksii]